MSSLPEQHYSKNSDCKPRLWDVTKCHLFVENITENALSDIASCLENITQQTASQEQINEIVTKIENMFTSNAKQTFGTKKQNYNEGNTHKKWFYHECRVARNAYHNIRKLYNKH